MQLNVVRNKGHINAVELMGDDKPPSDGVHTVLLDYNFQPNEKDFIITKSCYGVNHGIITIKLNVENDTNRIRYGQLVHNTLYYRNGQNIIFSIVDFVVSIVDIVETTDDIDGLIELNYDGERGTLEHQSKLYVLDYIFVKYKHLYDINLMKFFDNYGILNIENTS